MKKIILIIWTLISLLHGASQSESLRLYSKVDGNSVALKWMRIGYSSKSIYQLYRSEDGKKAELLVTLKPTRYETLISRGYDKEEYIFFIYPFHMVKNTTERTDVYRSTQMRNMFRLMKLIQDEQFAKNSGLFYRDESLKKGVNYRYFVKELNPKWSLVSNTARLKAFEQKDEKIMWIEAKDQHDSIGINFDTALGFGYYNLYRKLPSQQKFIRQNKLPRFVSDVNNKEREALFTDKKIAVEQSAQYYVTKIDMFGVEGTPSRRVTAKRTKKKLTPDQVHNIHVVNQGKKVTLHWGSVVNVISYDVYRSRIYQDRFEKMNTKPITKNSFVDTDFLNDKNYYYYIVAYNMHGASLPSTKVLAYAKDTTPPTRPSDLNATVDGSDVLLEWNISKDKELLGYRIYMAMKKDAREWSMLTKEAISENKFVHHRAKTLSRHPYFYKITAVDSKFNESKASNIVKVQIPDTIAPEQPIVKWTNAIPGRIELRWNRVRVYDLASYDVYRKGTKGFVRLNKKAILGTSFVDENPKKGANEYYVSAVDTSGNSSKAKIITTVMAKDNQAVKIDNLNVKRTNKGVQITFTVSDKDYNGFEIMRSGTTAGYYNISGFQKGFSYMDTSAQKGEQYLYTVKAYDKVGNIIESDVYEIAKEKK